MTPLSGGGFAFEVVRRPANYRWPGRDDDATG
jgi:hypothetical protein